jgi:hypothetical protein
MEYSPRKENLNLLVRSKFLNFFFYIALNKNWNFTGPNRYLLFFGRRTGAHTEDWGIIHTQFEFRWLHGSCFQYFSNESLVKFSSQLVAILVFKTSLKKDKLVKDCPMNIDVHVMIDWLLLNVQRAVFQLYLGRYLFYILTLYM